MEEEIGRLRKGIVTFCNHLESSCDALKQSLSRRPIPLDSATSTFTEILKRRISSTSVELNILETMSLGTVSLEELLGHCYEVFNSNNSLLLRLHSHLADLSLEDTESEGEKDIVALKVGMGSEDDLVSELHIPSSLPSADPLMDDSLSLKSMGLSDVCLATLASEANVKTEGNDSFLREPAMYDEKKQLPKKGLDSLLNSMEHQFEGETEDCMRPANPPMAILEVSKDDYDDLPSSLKSLCQWEDLLVAVEKINSGPREKENTKGSNYFSQDEIAALGLGPKARTYLLLLQRMNLLVVETVGGLISYKIL